MDDTGDTTERSFARIGPADGCLLMVVNETLGYCRCLTKHFDCVCHSA